MQSKNTRDFSHERFKYFNNHCVLYIWNDVFQNEQNTQNELWDMKLHVHSGTSLI